MDAVARRPSAIVSGSATRIGAATAEALARHGIDVTVNYNRSADEDLTAFKQKVAKLAPLRRLVSADDVAESVCWFALGGRSITGQLLVIDGGTHLTVGNPL